MADFSFLNQYAVSGDSRARLTLFGITLANGLSPTLIGRPCGQTNKGYFNALMRSSAKRSLTSGSRQSPAAMAEHRKVDRKFYPEFVITGWEDVVDAKSKEVPFSVDDCKGFIGHLPDHVFDEVRAFFLDMNNFVEDAVSVEEAVEKGNS